MKALVMIFLGMKRNFLKKNKKIVPVFYNRRPGPQRRAAGGGRASVDAAPARSVARGSARQTNTTREQV